MAESNATQVILTDDGIKIIKAQNMANNAVSGVTDLNDPNLMSVIEKQTQASQFAGLTSQYSVLVQNAKDEGINTDSLTTAYNNLNKFMVDVLTDPDHASDVNRDTYKSLTNAYNSALSNLQMVLKNNVDNKFTSAASATSQAASMANLAKSAADSSYNYADSQIAVNSQATAKAQSTADSAFNQATSAIDNGNVTSQAVADLKDGSKLTIADLENGLATKVANSDYSSYKQQTASQIAQKVDNGTFSAYQTTTADLIAQKVANSEFSAYQATTAKAIDSKVDNGDFQTYKSQAADAITSKVSNSDFEAETKLLSDDINLRVKKDGLIDEINLQAGNTLISSSGQLTLSGKNIYFDTNNPVIIPSANMDSVLVNKKLTAADISANTFTTNNGTFTVDKYGAVVASNLTIRGVTNLVYNSALLGGSSYGIPGWQLPNGHFSIATVHDGVSSIEFNSSTGSNSWSKIGQSKMYALNGSVGLPFSASVWFLDSNSDSSIQYNLGLAFYDSTGNRISVGNNTWNGRSTSQNWVYKTVENSVQPGNAAYVGIEYWAYNGTGHAYFSSPMLTQSARSTGYQPDTGNIISAGEIDGTVINGSTINGTTFNAGSKLNQYGNTSYPLTINPDGSVDSKTFKTIGNETAALRTIIKDGTVRTSLRGMTPFSTGAYSATDIALGAGQLALLAGYSTSQDPNFTASGFKSTGYVILDAETGLNLHGDTQGIVFNGTSDDVTPKGVIITPYGNINPNGTQNIWYVGNNLNMKTASFGMDGSGTYGIQFNRSLDIGNFNINTYHTITSSDNGPIHFNRANGNPVDIYADTVHYNSLVKSSLLSVKKDVQKADTAYWAQLVNSIDLATYQYKSDDNTSHIRLSSIVDDVNDTKQWQLPDMFVARDEDGKFVGVDDSVLLNATLATVQEQQKEIDQLNGHLLELEAKLNG